MQLGYQDVRGAASPAPVFFRLDGPMGHFFPAHNWCELLSVPSPFVPGISIAVVPMVRDCACVVSITLPARVALHPRFHFPINRFVLFIDNQLFPTHHFSCPSFGRSLDLGNFIEYPLRIL